MSDTLRWRYGDTNSIVLPVDSATVIEIGDLVWLDTDDAKPASAQADLGTEAQNQEAFHDKFAGVAMQRSRAGDTTPIRVATTGVFEFDTPNVTYEVGALLGPKGTGASEAVGLSNQTIESVATENLAVGRCAKRLNPAGTKVFVDIVSTVLRGGPQAMA
jgi:hypothetical protein